MTAEELNELIKSVRASPKKEEEKDKLIIELLDLVMKQNKEEMKGDCGGTEDKIKTTYGNLYNLKEEEQMLINIPGVSVNSVPRKDGRFQGYLIENNGMRKYFYGRSYKDVIEKIQIAFRQEQTALKRQSRDRAEEKTMINSKTKRSITEKLHPFNEYMENWIKRYKEPNVKPTSLQSIHSSVKPAILKLGDKPIEKITGDDIQSLLLSIQAPRVRDLCKLNISQAFKKAVLQGFIERNPCEMVEIKKYRSEHKKALTKTEQGKFLEKIDVSPYSLLYRLILYTGLRIGEALALTKADIDFEKCKLTVNKNVIFIKSKRIVQDTPKTEAGNRTIPIPDGICQELKAIEGDILFPFTYNAVKKALEKIAKELDIKMTLHTLRHTYATRLEEAGIPPKVKQYLLGHASLEMTQNTYTDTQTEYIDSMSNKIRSAF